MTRSRSVTWDDPLATFAGMEGRTGLEFIQAMAAGEVSAPPITHTMGLSVKFLGSARLGSGVQRCTGTVTHFGKRTALAEARVDDAAGKLLSTATSTCLILR